MGWRRVVAMLATGVMLFGAGPAAADDSALNKEGFWTVGRGEPDSTACSRGEKGWWGEGAKRP